MADTAAEREAVAAAIEDEGARPVWFEELGRDADPEESYLAGVDTSSIYIGVLNEQYGRLLETSFSATEAEYLRAREGGKRVAVYTAVEAPGREGHLNRFIERVHTLVTTESYRDPADLDRRVRRRLRELAAEALSLMARVLCRARPARSVAPCAPAAPTRSRSSSSTCSRPRWKSCAQAGYRVSTALARLGRPLAGLVGPGRAWSAGRELPAIRRRRR